jgi:hypothetical protein
MTEHLTALLAREADTLEVPTPPSGDILGAGRRLRHRRTAAIWGGAALAVAVVASGSVLIGSRGGGRDLAPAASPPVQVAWAVGDTVYVGTDGHAAQMPEVAQTLYYTSAGILVRTNKDGSSDGGAPFHFQLVRADGTASKLDVTLREVIPSTDPTQPYLAWATMTDGTIRVVVHDVRTGQDVAKVEVPGTFTWGGWEAPPVALSGDQVYVGTDGPTTVVNWRTGATGTSDVLPHHTVPEVFGGRLVTTTARGQRDAEAEVVDAATGRDLLDIPIGRLDQVTLSPDGRFAQVVTGAFDPPVHLNVYDVDSGDSVSLPDSVAGYGWASDGDLFQVAGNSLTLCPAGGGSCRTSTVPPVGSKNLVRYAGQAFES